MMEQAGNNGCQAKTEIEFGITKSGKEEGLSATWGGRKLESARELRPHSNH